MLQVHAAHPIPLGLQKLDEMVADEAPRPSDKNSLHATCSVPAPGSSRDGAERELVTTQPAEDDVDLLVDLVQVDAAQDVDGGVRQIVPDAVGVRHRIGIEPG